MTRLISIIAICYLTSSCNQDSKPAADHTLQNISASTTNEGEVDFVKSSPDKAKIVLENDYVRVIEYSLKPGEKDSMHTHPPKTSYVISGGSLRVYPINEKPFDTEEVTGTTEWEDRRGKHYVENVGKTTVTILLTEIKSTQ